MCSNLGNCAILQMRGSQRQHGEKRRPRSWFCHVVDRLISIAYNSQYFHSHFIWTTCVQMSFRMSPFVVENIIFLRSHLSNMHKVCERERERERMRQNTSWKDLRAGENENRRNQKRRTRRSDTVCIFSAQTPQRITGRNDRSKLPQVL